jgi:HK97 family phage prohead protease
LKVEVRSDGVHISGYVNATEKKSRPVVTPRGKVIEVVEPRAFEEALGRAGNISVTVDHDDTHIYASTDKGTLNLYEDEIGLHADVVITDPDLIETAKKGKIRGWSFGMYNVVDEMEERTEGYPIRHVKKLDIDHLTLVVNQTPVYAATSVEVRAGVDVDIETRSSESEVKVTVETPAKAEEPVNNSKFTNRLKEIQAGL